MDEVAIVEEVVELLPELSKLVHVSVASDSSLEGITLAQTKALNYLYHHGELTMSEVATGLAISLPSASELIERLVERGLVVRSVDSRDRRCTLLGISPAALARCRRVHDVRRAQVRAALSLLPPGDAPAFARSMRALTEALRDSRVVAGAGDRTEAVMG